MTRVNGSNPFEQRSRPRTADRQQAITAQNGVPPAVRFDRSGAAHLRGGMPRDIGDDDAPQADRWIS